MNNADTGGGRNEAAGADPVVIWGAGAMGGTIGGFLARAGRPVTFVDVVEPHVAAIRERGLRITGPIAEFTVRAPAFTVDDLQGRHATVLLAVKAHHTEAATRALEPHLTADGVVVSVQNGLNETVIAGIVGESRTFGCFVNFGADYLEPGVIHFGGRGSVVVGETDGRLTDRARRIHEAFLTFDERAILSPNVWGFLWSKLAYASMLFATALANDSIADALARPEHAALYAGLAREIVRVATARGVRLEPFDGFDPRAFAAGSPAGAAARSLEDLVAHNRKSAKTHSGIWRDLAVRRRRTEVDAQLGPVVDYGREAGLATPLNARLIELIHEIEDGRRPQDLANLNELAATISG
jgi:2-dehydropantoate 2-reductase